MGSLTFDFSFIENSLLHGEFLTEVYHSCGTDTKIEKVNNHYGYKANMVFLSVSVPEDIATVLKLRFGHCMLTRPVKEEAKEEVDSVLQKLKSRYKIKDYLKDMEEVKFAKKIYDPYYYDYYD